MPRAPAATCFSSLQYGLMSRLCWLGQHGCPNPYNPRNEPAGGSFDTDSRRPMSAGLPIASPTLSKRFGKPMRLQEISTGLEPHDGCPICSARIKLVEVEPHPSH